ncbi:hypothetical protein EPA93_13600 [Ktedonosporobacter rubrisoli]|uniref:Uncharacterized protein n=1 Tax=Ktedonosporobacter rubrisoli TaxID=2509675 RepID=A0A4P6JPH7_KTERU|nr:hypothetical protein [Ktedonosporobacter rubrisoli]QBD76982.1 hypothetical protein EPA93_13600 [Ktedonosporobacter rubrisoli]
MQDSLMQNLALIDAVPVRTGSALTNDDFDLDIKITTSPSAEGKQQQPQFIFTPLTCLHSCYGSACSC